MLQNSLRRGLPVFIIIALLGGCTQGSKFRLVSKQEKEDRNLPSLIVTDKAPPSVIYRRGSHDTVLEKSTSGVTVGIPTLAEQQINTIVTKKAEDLRREIDQLQESIRNSKRQFKVIQSKTDAESASYYALVASINRDLQTGTTPGNPILTSRWNTAQDKLHSLSQSTSILNTLMTDLSYQSSKAAFLLDSVHAAFSLSGAVDEDHRKLTELDDELNQEAVSLSRFQTRVTDELNRRSTYLRTERANLEALSLSITNGELYGQSLRNSIFKKATNIENMSIESQNTDLLPGTRPTPAPSAARRPLVIIRFDHPNVNFEQPLYTAISQALEKYPAAKFDLVAVSTADGDTGHLSMARTEARKNGEAVLRSLTKMGLPMERIRLNAANSKDVLNSEVHLYIR